MCFLAIDGPDPFASHSQGSDPEKFHSVFVAIAIFRVIISLLCYNLDTFQCKEAAKILCSLAAANVVGFTLERYRALQYSFSL